MNFTYLIADYYDWDPNGNLGAGIPAPGGGQFTVLTDAELHTMHTYGVMQNFKVQGSMTFRVTWQKSDIISTNIFPPLAGKANIFSP